MTKHYLVITDGFDTEDYEFYSIYGDDRDTLPVEHIYQLTSFANMGTEQIKKLYACCEATEGISGIDEYFEKVSITITDCFGESASNILTIELKNALLESKEDDEPHQILSIEQAKTILHRSIDEAKTWSRSYCNLLSDFYEDDLDTQLRTAHLVVSVIPPNIRYIPLAAISMKTEKLTYCNAYYVSNARDFFTLMTIFAIKEEKPIKKCKNCGKYFTPAAKRDEIYCLNCRDVSYDRKIREDEVLSCYRKIYKTQCARKARNSHRPRINEKFEQWKRLAITKRNDCKAGRISLEEMEAAISTQDWLNG